MTCVARYRLTYGTEHSIRMWSRNGRRYGSGSLGVLLVHRWGRAAVAARWLRNGWPG